MESSGLSGDDGVPFGARNEARRFAMVVLGDEMIGGGLKIADRTAESVLEASPGEIGERSPRRRSGRTTPRS